MAFDDPFDSPASAPVSPRRRGTQAIGGAFGGYMTDPDEEFDRVKLAQVVGGGAAGMGLPSFAETQARIARDALRDPTFLRSFFGNVPTSAVDDEGYQQYARQNALARGRALQDRRNWWDDPRQQERAGYQSLLNDRAAQGQYFLKTYGFDPLTGQVANAADPRLLEAAAAWGERIAGPQRAAGLFGRQYGDQFTLLAESGENGTPYGYRKYADQYGNTFLVDGRGNIVR